MVDIGIIHGRFQPFHLGHLEYLMAGQRQSQFLYVGISNPDPGLTSEHSANVTRSQATSNPFTFWERMLMIERTLLSEGVARDKFAVVPFPINFPEYLACYVPQSATCFITIYDEWGRAKRTMLQEAGFAIEVLWERRREELLTSGTEVRSLMAAGLPWRQLVPQSVADVIVELGLETRSRNR
jgi:cytidyltransferase-like protein